MIRLLLTLALLGCLSAGPTRAVTRLPAAIRTPSPADRVSDALRAGRVANAMGNFADAEAAFRSGLELQGAVTPENSAAVAATLLELALNVSNQGRHDEAAALFRRAAPLLEASSDSVSRARLTTYLAEAAATTGDFALALRYGRDASEQWRKLSVETQNRSAAVTGPNAAESVDASEFGHALTLQSRLELRQNNILQAYGAASQALLILNASTVAPLWWKADTLVALGEISVAQGRISAAETYFNAGLRIKQHLFGDSVPAIDVLLALGKAYQEEGLNSSAIVTYREVFRMARTLPAAAGIFTADMLIPFATAIVATAATIPDSERRRGLFAEGFDAFQLVGSPLVDKTIAQTAARLAATDPAIGTMIAALQDHQRSADLAHVKLIYEQSLPDNDRSGAVEQRLIVQTSTERAAVASARQLLKASFPAYDELVASRPLQLDAVRALLKPGEGVISFLVGRDKSFAQLVTRDGVTIAAVPEGGMALREAVTVLRRPLDVDGGSAGEFDLGSAHRLYEVLLGDLAPSLAGLDHLVVVPAGPLSNLPFGLLVTASAREADYAHAQWLIRHDSIAYTPSLQALARLRTAQRSRSPGKPLLGFGAPVLTGAVHTSGGTTAMSQLTQACRESGPMPAALLQALAPLPDTARELNAAALALGAGPDSIFVGAAATEENLRRRSLDDYRVVYFATHGLLPGELRCQAEPGLVLTPPSLQAISRATDGLLESSEIAALQLNADLVVLSACNTAAGSGQAGGGDALSGLAEAFFHAGARNLVVSHWPVPSAATTALMTGMLKAWTRGGGENIGDALRQAQLALIADPRTAHPIFWAAFVAVGDGLGKPSAATLGGT